MTEAQQLLSPIPALQCPTLPPPLNGRVSASGGDTATYTCSTGYTLIGSSTRTCQTNEQWSGATPTCSEVQCPELSPLSHGTVTLSGRLGAFYRCSTGYILSGYSARFCHNGVWSGNAPTCRGDCNVVISCWLIDLSQLNTYIALIVNNKNWSSATSFPHTSITMPHSPPSSQWKCVC